MKILITGVAGFLGSNLSRVLLKKGHTILGVDDLSVGNYEYVRNIGMDGITIQELSTLNISKQYMVFNDSRKEQDWCITSMVSNIDLIIHLASRKIPREGNPDRVLKENALGIMKVIEIAKKFDSKIIYLSSSEIYGANCHTYEAAHSIFPDPKNPRWSYGLSKLWSENYLHGTEGVRFNIIRLFANYGPYNCRHWRAGPIPVFIEQILNNKPLTINGGQQTRCFMYVDDAVRAILKIIERDDIDGETYNIGNPNEETTVQGLAYMISRLMGVDDPGFKFSKSCEIQSRKPEIGKAMLELGFIPQVQLEEGLNKTIEWHKQIRQQKE